MMRKFYFFTPFLSISLLLLCPAAPVLPLGLPGLSRGPAGEFSLDLLWSGSCTYEWDAAHPLHFINRGDIRLHAHKPALTLRAQVTDKRPSSSSGRFTDGNTAFAGGLYHTATGSRFLWGILDEGGLPARIKNVWNRGVPFAEQHRGAVGDLRVEPSATKKPVSYLWLGSPWWEIPGTKVPWLGPVRGFGSVLLDDKIQAAFDGGFEIGLLQKSTLRMEGFYTRQHLAPKSPAAWFSETPPLPERDSGIVAGSVLFNSPLFAAAGDIAWSQTFAYGEDLYGNLAFRIGEKPWRLSLAADAAGSRYVGRDGNATGAGFRAAAKLERRGKRSSLFRASSALRSGGLGEKFYRSATVFYYHFPTAPAKSTSLFWPSRVSLTINRDATNPSGSKDTEKIEDSIKALGGFRVWKIPLVFQAALCGLCAAESPLPYPGADYPYDFASAKISGEASYTLPLNSRRFKTVQFGTKLGYTIKNKGDNQVAAGLSASARGKWGRVSIKVNAGDFPQDWEVGVSWRLQL